MKVRSGFVSNSSSSSFVLDTDYSLEEIKHKLEVLLKFYNEWNEKKYKFKDMFSEPFIVDEDFIEDMKDWDYSWKVGDKVVESTEENSIPYELWNLISDKFNAERYHLG